MNCKLHLFTLAFFIWAMVPHTTCAQSGHYEQLFEQANQAYKEGNYDTAQSIYTSIAQNGMVSSELLYNLGNTYYKLNSIPAAILYYERALRLDPGHEDALYNLGIANSFVTDNIKPIEPIFLSAWWTSMAMGMSLAMWSIVWLVVLILTALLFTLFFVSTHVRTKQMGFLAGVVVALCAVVVFMLANTQYQKIQRKEAIVFASTVSVKSEPRLNGTDQFVIHEGVKLLVLDTDGDWSRIELADGNSGWLPNKSIERI